jgi:FkbM family methyltransferase
MSGNASESVDKPLSSAHASAPLKCAVIIPVGPGHELLALDAVESVLKAAESPTPFGDVLVIRVDDNAGEMGRSAARNEGVKRAKCAGASWVFFLDADDVIHPMAFSHVAPYIGSFDAIWGAIHELAEDEIHGVMRANQLLEISNIAQLLGNDPRATLQMGHFVKTDIALANPFDTRLDAGEDFDYYLRVWSKYRCIKVPLPLFFNRRGMHSSGPRAATGRQWQTAAQRVICEKCTELDFHSDFTHDGQEVRFYIFNPFDAIQRCHLKGHFFEIVELDHLKTWIAPGANILEVGAYVGNHVVYYSKLLQPRRITVMEPNADIIPLLLRNIAVNKVENADLSLLGLAAGKQEELCRIISDDPNNLGTAHLEPAHDGKVKCAPLDHVIEGVVDFVKIDAEGMELDVLQGAARLIAKSRPKIMIEVFMKNIPAFMVWTRREGYHIAREFRYVNAVNFFLEPAPDAVETGQLSG